MIRSKRPCHGEGCIAHPERAENLLQHRRVVSGAEFALWVHDVGTDVPGRRGHQVAILKYLTEAAGRLSGCQQLEGMGGGCLRRGCEAPFEVLARQPSTGAHQVAYKHLVRGRLATKPKRWIGFDDRLVPA